MGRKSTSDETRSERPNKVTNPKMVEKIQKIVMDDRRAKVRDMEDISSMVREIAEVGGISCIL